MAWPNKLTIFLYIISIVICNVYGYCNETFMPLKCAYDIFCQNQFEIRYWDHYRVDSRSDLSNMYDMSDCNLNINGYNYIHLNLIYKDDMPSTIYGSSIYNPLHTIPYTEDTENNLHGLRLITSLDLSNNNYELPPVLSAMDNLAFLKLSNNSLRVAKLSNAENLPSLVDIDLSRNTISDIEYDSYNVYRTLKKLDLSYNYLTHISEAIFDPFDELETLDVSHNYIDTLSPITFEGAKHLLYLNISYNRISDINSSLFRFSGLKHLDFSNNRIKHVRASDFDKLINLKTLDMSFNSLSIIEKESFQNMPVLIDLYLNNNKLENIDKETFHNVSSLVNINLSENNFKILPRGLFKNKRINYFSIVGNQLEGPLEKGTFDGLYFVTKLDLSNQHLESIENYALNGLDNLIVLLLNNNRIRVLSSKSLKMMRKLKRLDLSFNKIDNIDFEKDDLFNLFSLSLRNNFLTVIRQEDFSGLNSLQFLDLSDNKIALVETNSFKSLHDLINFEISNNPLIGTLKQNTFDGLNSLPSLDISCTLISTVQNNSFTGMIQLINLNISHSKINTIEFNAFVHTGAIETLDLSFNELKDFIINSTELATLKTLILTNNLIKTLDLATFKSISRLTKLDLSYNTIRDINPNTLKNLMYLSTLDISYNLNITYTLSLLNATKNINVLNLSGIKTDISFGNIKDVSFSQLIISNSSVSDVKLLQMNELRNLDTLYLSDNNISKLEVGGLSNMTSLKILDISRNKITYIQPGVFKDNTMLYSLNFSHNFLTVIPYGIFRGLIYLNTLDISFNHITDLQNERFYEVKSLSFLIADHNKIETLNAEDFVGTSLTQLSIGGNPIPCEILVNLKKNNAFFEITASRLFDNNDENVDGVTCNKKTLSYGKITDAGTPNTINNDKVLLSIRDILLDRLNNQQTSPPTSKIDEIYYVNVTNEIKQSNIDINTKISNILNFMMNAVKNESYKNNQTNILLDKILKVLTFKSTTKSPPVQVTKDNATYENLLTYINKVRQDLEDTVENEKNSILNEMESKISAANTHFNPILLPTEMPKHEKIVSADPTKSFFTETCVALILVILVCFVLFKIYKSGIFVRRRFSVSTRELPGSLDSAL